MSTPALAAHTWAWNGVGVKAWPAEIWITQAPGWRRCACASRATLKLPSRSMSTTVLKALGDMSSALARKLPAAPETSTSMGPKRSRGLREGAFQRLGLAHVGRDAERLGAQGFELRRRRGHLVGRAAEQPDARAGAGEGLRDAEVDAAGAAGHEHVAAMEVEGGEVHVAFIPA